MKNPFRKPCEDCKQKYFVHMTGEDGKKYLVPFPVIYCPTCGRRLTVGRN